MKKDSLQNALFFAHDITVSITAKETSVGAILARFISEGHARNCREMWNISEKIRRVFFNGIYAIFFLFRSRLLHRRIFATRDRFS